MSYLTWTFVLVFTFLTFVMLVGKRKWDAYAEMARLRPDERILHEEKDVPIKTKTWAAFPLYNWTFAGGAPEEYGFLTADVSITNERILVFQNGVPVSIVNFTHPETLPGSWLAWREEFLLNVAKSDIQVTMDESGKPCLEVVYAPHKGHGVRKRHYLRDLEVARVCFPTEEQAKQGPLCVNYDGATTHLVDDEYLGIDSIVEERDDRSFDPTGSGNIYTNLDRFGQLTNCQWEDYGSSTDAAQIHYGYDRVKQVRVLPDTIVSQAAEEALKLMNSIQCFGSAHCKTTTTGDAID